MADLYIIETENGGDAILNGSDILLAKGYESLVYMSLFGGDDWFGNGLLVTTEKEMFNSHTEKVMSSVALDSSGRTKIESAIKKDLEYIGIHIPDTEIRVNVKMISDDRISIYITIVGNEYFSNIEIFNPTKPKSRQIFFGQFTAQFTVQFTKRK